MRTKTRPETTNLMVLCFDPRRASAKSLQSGLPVRRIDRLRPGTNSATILEPTQGRAECRGGLGVTDGDRGTAPPLPESAAPRWPSQAAQESQTRRPRGRGLAGGVRKNATDKQR